MTSGWPPHSAKLLRARYAPRHFFFQSWADGESGTDRQQNPRSTPFAGSIPPAGHEDGLCSSRLSPFWFFSSPLPAVCGLLLLGIGLAFGQTARHRFVNIDDDECVYRNGEVADGLSWHGIKAAFTRSQADNWVPLTWISHMLDWQIYGGNAGGHHLTNVLLHAAATVLLFLALVRLTDRASGTDTRSSGAPATLDVPHCLVERRSRCPVRADPLRAESVAWVTERKDVLSGVFFGWRFGPMPVMCDNVCRCHATWRSCFSSASGCWPNRCS